MKESAIEFFLSHLDGHRPYLGTRGTEKAAGIEEQAHTGSELTLVISDEVNRYRALQIHTGLMESVCDSRVALPPDSFSFHALEPTNQSLRHDTVSPLKLLTLSQRHH